MFDNHIDTKYNTLIKHLTLSGYKCKKKSIECIYQKENIIIKFNPIDITIKDNQNNRRFYFNSDTSNTILVNFLDFLTNNYNEALI